MADCVREWYYELSYETPEGDACASAVGSWVSAEAAREALEARQRRLVERGAKRVAGTVNPVRTS